MELFILLIALLAEQKKQGDFLRPLGRFLESGEISAIIKSDWFRAQTFGSVNGKELAEAYENAAKLADGPYRFPAFWEPGYDWAPDHNRGGGAMIGLQEMLLQETPDGELLLFPAWPKDVDASFRLHATGGRIVEAEIKDGKIKSNVIVECK